MMDRTSSVIVDYAAASRTAKLGPDASRAVRRTLVDVLACAVGGLRSQPADVARALAAGTASDPGATAFGHPRPTSIELAVFANTVMTRYLDWNDTYFTQRGGGGHPSDVVPTALAVGEAVHASGPAVMSAIACGYEIIGGLASAVWVRERGWDQGINVVAATAMIAGCLLGLDAGELGHALALAVTPNVPVRQTRIGHLSMWKGCATAGAARNGVFAALLAQHGMTGPPEPYEGRSGIWEQVTGPFDLRLPVNSDDLVIQDAQTKLRPAEFNAQGPIELAVQIRGSADLASVTDIELQTYWLTYHEIGMDDAKWDPRTRETADHSLPWLLAVALTDGNVDLDSCSPARLADPSVRALMAKVRITENPAFTARFPREFPNRLVVRTADGREVARELSHPPGHRRSPVDDDQINEKLDFVLRGCSDQDAKLVRDARDGLWNVDQIDDVATLLRPLSRLEASGDAVV
jgi:2-methylcitrate dehydratase